MSRSQTDPRVVSLLARHQVAPLVLTLKARLYARIRIPARFLLWLWSWCRIGRGAPVGLSRRRALDALRRGFFCTSYALYELHRNDASAYFSDRAYTLHAADFNGGHDRCINSKLAFAHSLRVLGLRVPEVFGILEGGRLYPDDAAAAPVPAETGITEALRRHRRAVLKPIFAWGGAGLAFLERRDGALLLNGAPVKAAELAEIARGLRGYLLTEFVEQHPYAAAIFPETTNTLRLLTLWDSDAGVPFLAAAAHRFGTLRSGRIDNFHGGHGGLSAPIDRETGVLGEAAAFSATGGVERRRRHPDTGAEIAGVAVPGWAAAKEHLLAVAACLPHAPCIGWDLVVTEQGMVCLEGNAPPGVYVWQVHEPLLADPRNRRFYVEHGAARGAL